MKKGELWGCFSNVQVNLIYLFLRKLQNNGSRRLICTKLLDCNITYEDTCFNDYSLGCVCSGEFIFEIFLFNQTDQSRMRRLVATYEEITFNLLLISCHGRKWLKGNFSPKRIMTIQVNLMKLQRRGDYGTVTLCSSRISSHFSFRNLNNICTRHMAKE